MMFFANPVQALRNVRDALLPGGRLVRRRLATQARQRLGAPGRAGGGPVPGGARGDRCARPAAPGPFSMANADTVSEQLQIAGFEETPSPAATCRSRSATTWSMRSRFNMAIGPAAELIRLNPESGGRASPGARRRSCARRSRTSRAPTERPAPASTWIISATAPVLGRPPGFRLTFGRWPRHFPRRESPRGSPRSAGS